MYVFARIGSTNLAIQMKMIARLYTPCVKSFFYFTTEDTKESLPVSVSIHILYMLLLLHVNHFSVILMFYMGIKFCVFKVRDFFTIAKNAKLITNKAELRKTIKI